MTYHIRARIRIFADGPYIRMWRPSAPRDSHVAGCVPPRCSCPPEPQFFAYRLFDQTRSHGPHRFFSNWHKGIEHFLKHVAAENGDTEAPVCVFCLKFTGARSQEFPA